MKTRKLLTALLAASLILSGVFCATGLLVSADEPAHGYVTDGLVSLYSGTHNSDNGHDPSATVWQDIVGDNDLDVTGSEFNEQGLFMSEDDQHHFPQPIVDLVNGEEFTVEIFFGAFDSVGSAYNTFLNSRNDNFALYREVGADVIVLKFGGNPGTERPRVYDGLACLEYGLISVTYKVDGDCRIYVDGELAAEVPCDRFMNADNLFIGLAMDVKAYEATYRSIRFYDRELTADEIAANAAVDGFEAPPETTEAPTEEPTEEPTDAPTDAPTEYTVSFEINGYPFDQPAAVTVVEGECVSQPTVDLPDDGSRFDGWYTSPDCNADSKFDFATPIAGDMTLYAALIPLETVASTTEPTEAPTAEPTDTPTEAPTAEPTDAPTEASTAVDTTAETTEEASSGCKASALLSGSLLVALLAGVSTCVKRKD